MHSFIHVPIQTLMDACILNLADTQLTISNPQISYSIPDQSENGSACHMTRSADRCRHSVVISFLAGQVWVNVMG